MRAFILQEKTLTDLAGDVREQFVQQMGGRRRFDHILIIMESGNVVHYMFRADLCGLYERCCTKTGVWFNPAKEFKIEIANLVWEDKIDVATLQYLHQSLAEDGNLRYERACQVVAD